MFVICGVYDRLYFVFVGISECSVTANIPVLGTGDSGFESRHSDNLMIKSKVIKQVVNIKASPEDIYNVLMSSKKHSELTGSEAKISQKEGGKFSVYDSYATGKNIELVVGKKIVQEWKASDWEEGENSVVTFDLKKTKTGTQITFTHKNVPADQIESISQGWKDFYWEPLKEMFRD